MTIKYYDSNCQAFYQRTINADLRSIYESFTKLLPPEKIILDAGCGVGRDTKYFLSLGYKVVAFDPSDEMRKLAQKETHQKICNLCFQEMNFINMFDGVWASASFLHIPYEEAADVLFKIYNALKIKGVFYCSVKYGDSKREVAERAFYDWNEKMIKPHLEKYFSDITFWNTSDLGLSPSPQKKWLNILCRKRS